MQLTLQTDMIIITTNESIDNTKNNMNNDNDNELTEIGIKVIKHKKNIILILTYGFRM